MTTQRSDRRGLVTPDGVDIPTCGLCDDREPCPCGGDDACPRCDGSAWAPIEHCCDCRSTDTCACDTIPLDLGGAR